MLEVAGFECRSRLMIVLAHEKVKLSLCLTKGVCGSGCTNIESHFLTSALAGGDWAASCPCRFTPGERSSQYPLDRRLGGLQSRSG
jgi:hypothetical protein